MRNDLPGVEFVFKGNGRRQLETCKLGRKRVLGFELLFSPAVGRHEVDGDLVVLGARECDPASVGRPHRAAVIIIVGQLQVMIASDLSGVDSGPSGRRVLAIERDGVAIRRESGRCGVGQRYQGTRVFDRQRSKFAGRLGRELDRQTGNQQNCKDCADAEEQTRYEFRG